MELSKSERMQIYGLLISRYPSSYMQDSFGLHKGAGGSFMKKPLTDDELVLAITRLGNNTEKQVVAIREVLQGLNRERRICIGCGEPYGAIRKNQKYCHRRCSARVYQRAYRKRKKQGDK